jgi:hypothetical protein
MLATKSNSYTFQKDGIWYFSRRVPADLRRHYRTGRIAYSLRTKFVVFISLLFLFLSSGPSNAWELQSGRLGEVKICRIIKPIDDGVIMVEMSDLFQGIAIFSKDAAELKLSQSKKYGYSVDIWSDENPISKTYAWQDLRGILVPLTIGKWVNGWDFIVQAQMLRGKELKLGFSENSWPNQPEIRVPLAGFRATFTDFIACAQEQWKTE